MKEKLSSSFMLTDLGELSYYLGISFERKGNKMHVHQPAYWKRVLERFWMEFSKSAPTPMVDNIDNAVRDALSSKAEQDYGQ